MTQLRKNFIKVNTPFTCANCGKKVPPHLTSCRNHCPYCLFSKHVDIIPGDREESCKGLMRPDRVEYKGGEFTIIHKCEKCGVEKRNKAAEDDDKELLRELSLIH